MRQMLRRHGYNNAEVVGIFYLPSVGDDPVRCRALANTYAALTELQYYSSGESVFRARYVSPEKAAATIEGIHRGRAPLPAQLSAQVARTQARLAQLRPRRHRGGRAGGRVYFPRPGHVAGQGAGLRRTQADSSALQSPGPVFSSVGLYRLDLAAPADHGTGRPQICANGSSTAG